MFDSYSISLDTNARHTDVVRCIDRYINSKKNAHRKNIRYHFRETILKTNRGKEVRGYMITATGFMEIITTLNKLHHSEKAT